NPSSLSSTGFWELSLVLGYGSASFHQLLDEGSMMTVRIFTDLIIRYFVVYTDHIFLIHSLAEEYLGCFQVLAIRNKAAMNTVEQVSLWKAIAEEINIVRPPAGTACALSQQKEEKNVVYCFTDFYV
ncbi:hypothetical protein STEG23_001403, partial [Scotinomys teguina]